IADEPTTALDVTIQAQVLELIKSLTQQLGSSVIMITHDLGVVASMCSRILIMYGGKIVEQGSDEEIFYQARHPYTIGLLRSINNPDADVKQELIPIPGSPPNLLNPPAGCPFVDRCDRAMLVCKNRMPDVTVFSETHQASCWQHHPLAAQAAQKEVSHHAN
ncbi:MAG: ABC transporter ATP-binding protein, partial [Clostridiales bacterium]|nr:ABC transporter ATP-binding protein [Clostridiales bacterium]